MSALSIVLNGQIKLDGSLELESTPRLRPGAVRVPLELVERRAKELAAPLPDPPIDDECISAPFDLPRPEKAEPIKVHKVIARLPEPFEWTEEDLAHDLRGSASARHAHPTIGPKRNTR